MSNTLYSLGIGGHRFLVLGLGFVCVARVTRLILWLWPRVCRNSDVGADQVKRPPMLTCVNRIFPLALLACLSVRTGRSKEIETILLEIVKLPV